LATINQSTVRGYNEMLQTYAAIDYNTLNATGVASPVMPNNGSRSVLTTDFFNQTETQTRYTSYYANAAYTFNRKYTVNTSWRIDQSNLFGKDKSAQNKPVWSAGARWTLSDEKFHEGNILAKPLSGTQHLWGHRQFAFARIGFIV
jgi:hypothetical protein